MHTRRRAANLLTRSFTPQRLPILPSLLVAIAVILVPIGCSTVTTAQKTAVAVAGDADSLRVLDRVTWGANASSARDVRRLGVDGFLAAQLRRDGAARLPESIAAQIAQSTDGQPPLVQRVVALEAQRRDGD